MRTAVSARCAGACPLRRTYTREEQPPTKREEKGARLSTKRSQERHKTREHSKESPLVFIIHHHNAKKIWKLFRKNAFYSKQKIYLCAWTNTTFPFPAALRCPYSAKQTNYRPHNQRTRSLTDWKNPDISPTGRKVGRRKCRSSPTKTGLAPKQNECPLEKRAQHPTKWVRSLAFLRIKFGASDIWSSYKNSLPLQPIHINLKLK